ncbi:MAG: universal stress protein [Bacteroidetes bacterium]|nr:universal stress protein [Bacteroidota bacterium]
MKRILVPVDFSDAARRALHFAKDLCKRLDGELEVAFFYHPHFDAADPNRLSPNTELQKIHREQMDKLMKKENLPPSSGNVLMGFPGDSLVELSKGKEVDLIIMGARGEHGALDKLFGTVSSHVSLHAHCPVLIIPEDAPEMKDINRIVYGLEFPYADEPSVRKIAKLARNLQADLHFVHIVEEDRSITDEELKEMYDGIFETITENQHFHLVTVIGDEEILEGLEEYAKDNAGDLLVLVARERSWWQRLLFPNRTRKLALETDLPLLVLHSSDKAN